MCQGDGIYHCFFTFYARTAAAIASSVRGVLQNIHYTGRQVYKGIIIILHIYVTHYGGICLRKDEIKRVWYQ